MKIPFGNSQHNDYVKLNDHIAILHSPVSDETFFVYKNDVESLIAALTQAKEYWNEKLSIVFYSYFFCSNCIS